jgi:hypothetical protein
LTNLWRCRIVGAGSANCVPGKAFFSLCAQACKSAESAKQHSKATAGEMMTKTKLPKLSDTSARRLAAALAALVFFAAAASFALDATLASHSHFSLGAGEACLSCALREASQALLRELAAPLFALALSMHCGARRGAPPPTASPGSFNSPVALKFRINI